MKLTYGKFIAGIIFLFFISACGSKSSETKTTQTGGTQRGNVPPLKVEGFVVTASTLNQSLDVSGTLLPYEETEIHPEVAGRIVSLNIREGASVGRGTVLAKLFDGDLQARLNKLRVQLQIANKTQERQQQLLNIGGISRQDYDLSVLNTSGIRSDMQVLQADISRTVIRAPFSGKMGFKNVSIGAYITPQTVVTTIRQIDKLKLEFSIPEKFNNKIAMGNIITFTVEGAPGKHTAKIISTESEISAENRALKVRALVTDVKGLSAGSFAKVNFDMGTDNAAIMIPSQAVIPGARDKKVIVSNNGVATFKVVTTGDRDSAKVQIVTGLNVGDTVITTGILQLKPNSKLIVLSIKK